MRINKNFYFLLFLDLIILIIPISFQKLKNWSFLFPQKTKNLFLFVFTCFFLFFLRPPKAYHYLFKNFFPPWM